MSEVAALSFGQADMRARIESLDAAELDCLDFGVGATRTDADKLADTIMNIENATDVGTSLVGAFPQVK